MSEPTNDGGFSADQLRALGYVLDEIIPRSGDGRLPGAGAVGVADYVAQSLRRTPELVAMFVASLAALDRLATRRGAERFTALPADARAAVTQELAASEDAFPPILMLQTFAGYYQQPRVVELLGLPPRPPHPLGYEMGADDLTLLEAVRRRPSLYRRR